MTGFRHSLTPFSKTISASTDAMAIEKISAPSNANDTVQAIGLKRRPSTLCRVKMGR